MSKGNLAGILAGVGKAVEVGANAYKKKRDEAAAKEVLNDEKSTPVQKALAWETLTPGHGKGFYDAELKQKALQQKEQNKEFIQNELNGRNRSTVEAGAVEEPIQTQRSPVETANQILTPQQQMNPEEVPQGQQLPNEPVSPAMQAMMQTQEPQNVPQRTVPTKQGAAQNQNPQDPYAHIPTSKLQEYLGQTDDPATVRQLQSIIKDRADTAKNNTKLEAARIQGQIGENKENREEIRKYAEPYQNTQKFEKIERDMERAEDIVFNSESFSFEEGPFRTALAGIIEGKESKQHLAEIFKSPEQQEMFSLMYDSLNPKALGGSNPSTKEVLLSMSRQVSPYKGKAANMFIINNMLAVAKEETAKSKIINKTRLENPNMTFPELQAQVNKEMEQVSAEIREETDFKMKVYNAKDLVKSKPPAQGFNVMMNKQGKLKEVPANRVLEQQSKGNVLIQ